MFSLLLGYLKLSVSNIIFFWSTIWADKDWDYYYLIHLMIKKLEKMNKFFMDEKKCMSLDHKQRAREMRVVICLLKRINNGYYRNYISRRTYTLGGYSKHDMSDKALSSMDKTEMKQWKKKIDADLDYAFYFLRKNIKKWWD